MELLDQSLLYCDVRASEPTAFGYVLIDELPG